MDSDIKALIAQTKKLISDSEEQLAAHRKAGLAFEKQLAASKALLARLQEDLQRSSANLN